MERSSLRGRKLWFEMICFCVAGPTWWLPRSANNPYSTCLPFISSSLTVKWIRNSFDTLRPGLKLNGSMHPANKIYLITIELQSAYSNAGPYPGIQTYRVSMLDCNFKSVELKKAFLPVYRIPYTLYPWCSNIDTECDGEEELLSFQLSTFNYRNQGDPYLIKSTGL